MGGFLAKLLFKEVAETGTKVAARELTETGAKLATKELVETGTKAATKQVVETGVEDASKMALRHLGEKQALQTAQLGERHALERAGAGLTDQFAKTGAQTVEETASRTVTKPAGFLESLTRRSSARIYYFSRDMSLADKLSILEQRGETKYVQLLVDNARKTGIDKNPAMRRTILSEILNDSHISQATKDSFREIVDARRGGTMVTKLANLKGTFQYAAAHPGRAVLGATATTASTAATWSLKGTWFAITHPKTALLTLAGAEVVDQTMLGGAGTHLVENHIVEPLWKRAETAVDNKLQHSLGVRPFGTKSDGSSSESGPGTGGSGGNTNDDGSHWWDSLKKYASTLTGPWAILGMILNVVAWIGEALGNLSGSLFSKDTKVQTNNPGRVAAVTDTDQRSMQASLVNHNGQKLSSPLDALVPQLAPGPAAPAPG